MVWRAERQACESLCVGWMSTLLLPYQNKRYHTAILDAGGRYLLPAERCKAQDGQKDFDMKKGNSSGFLINSNGIQFGKRYECQFLHQYVLYLNTGKHKQPDIPMIDATAPPPFSVYIENWYLQQVVTEYYLYGNLQFHLSLFLSYMAEHDSVIFGYSWSVEIARAG